MSDYDITGDMDELEYAVYGMRQNRKKRVEALIKKYGFPVREEDLAAEDYFEYDMLKEDLAEIENEAFAGLPLRRGYVLDNEDMDMNAKIFRAHKVAKEDGRFRTNG